MQIRFNGNLYSICVEMGKSNNVNRILYNFFCTKKGRENNLNNRKDTKSVSFLLLRHKCVLCISDTEIRKQIYAPKKESNTLAPFEANF